jgi:iron complex transport system substrate-binding protein
MRQRPLRRSRLRLAAAAAASVAIMLTGCAGGSGGATGDGGGDAGDGAFPVTIEHAFGETSIESEPTRVATWGWGSTEAALAVGVVPVAIGEQVYGASEDGVLPWVAEELDEMGEQTPIILTDDGEAPPYEEIVEAAPDVILAPYSGVTEEQYELLSEIAPTVAYEGEAWTTPWDEVIRTVGESLGKAAEADAVLRDIDTTLAGFAAEHPELDGKTLAAVWDIAGTFYVYKPADPRVSFLFQLGLENAPAVDELANGDETFFYTLSYEQLDRLESDIVLSYHDTQAEADAFLASGPTRAIPAVSRGAVAQLVGTELIAAVSPPTALSITWGLDDLVESLSAAAIVGAG